MSPRRKLRLLILCAAALPLPPTPALALNRSWTNSSGGPFNTPSNWSPAGVPGTGDSAFFGLGIATYTVTFPADVTNTQLTIDQNNVTFNPVPPVSAHRRRR